MFKELYQERLITFSSTDKYLIELDFLFCLMSPINETDVILDYGCGIGKTIKFLQQNSEAKIFGYDIEKYIDEDLSCRFISEINGVFSKIIFQHSIAHITNINEVLLDIREKLNKNAEIYVITPNKEFDDYFKRKKDPKYIPDSTVEKHYTSEEIQNIFLSNGFRIKIAGTFGKIVENIHERCFLVAVK